MTTVDINCVGYAVKADIYEAAGDGPLLLSLIGRTSNRKKSRYADFLSKIAQDNNITSVIFDYSGHGDSPYDIEELRPAQQFIEVITVFDWMKEQYPNKKVIVIGSSYGGFMATQLTKYRAFDALVLRAPAIYRPADFYTIKKNEDTAATMSFRKDADKLATHPLLARASKFGGRVLVVVHKHDELVPVETTDAYAKAFNAEVLVEKDIPHSLDDATPEQVKLYFEHIGDWLSKT